MARAISWIAGGLILAMIAGAPIGTYIGQRYGWRVTFLALLAVAVGCVVLLAVSLPADAGSGVAHGVVDQVRSTLRPQVLVAILFSALGQTGFFTAYTYVTAVLGDVARFDQDAVTLLLMLFGVGGMVGNLVGGWFTDRHVPRAIVTLMATMAGVLVLFSVCAPSRPLTVVMVFLLGAAGFAVVPGYQTRVLSAAGGSAVAVATNTSGINVGVALGSMIGGLALAQGLSARNLGWIGAVATGLGLAVAVTAMRSELGRPHPAATPQDGRVEPAPAQEPQAHAGQ